MQAEELKYNGPSKARLSGSNFLQSIPINRYTINRYENDDFPKKMIIF